MAVFVFLSAIHNPLQSALKSRHRFRPPKSSHEQHNNFKSRRTLITELSRSIHKTASARENPKFRREMAAIAESRPCPVRSREPSLPLRTLCFYKRAKHRSRVRCTADDTEAASSAAGPAAAPTLASPSLLALVATEVRAGVFWQQCKAALPKVPWGPPQLAAVMVTVPVGILGVSALSPNWLVTLTSGSAEAAAAAAAANQHLAQECTVAAVVTTALVLSLQSSRPLQSGCFSLGLRRTAESLASSSNTSAATSTSASTSASSGDSSSRSSDSSSSSSSSSSSREQSGARWLLDVALLCAVIFPFVDPVLYNAWRGLVEEALGAVVRATGGDAGDGATAAAATATGRAYADALHAAAAQHDAATLAKHFAATCFVGPAWEELFWRGFLLQSTTKVLPLPASVALSSASFAALHVNPLNAAPILLLSAVCDLLYLRTGGLAAPLTLHALWNAYQFVQVAALGKDSFV